MGRGCIPGYAVFDYRGLMSIRSWSFNTGSKGKEGSERGNPCRNGRLCVSDVIAAVSLMLSCRHSGNTDADAWTPLFDILTGGI